MKLIIENACASKQQVWVHFGFIGTLTVTFDIEVGAHTTVDSGNYKTTQTPEKLSSRLRN